MRFGNSLGGLMTGSRRAAGWLFCLLATLVLAGSTQELHAQGVSGRILGGVEDTSGAAIARATVKATDVGTGIATTTASDANGQYRFDNLPPGAYRVEFNAVGFRPFVSNGNVVNLDQSTRVDASLQVGTQSETIEVTAVQPLVDTTSSSLGEVLSQKDIGKFG